MDYTKAASMVLMDGLMQRVSTAEEDFAEMPLELMAAIRQDPELKDELHGILLRAKEKVLREDG